MIGGGRRLLQRPRWRRLVEPGGKVFAYEIDAQLAETAKQNLAGYQNVTLIHGDAVTARLKRADLIYVNAGVIAPPSPLAEGSEARRPNDLSVAAGLTRSASRSWPREAGRVLPCRSSATPGSSPAAAHRMPI